MKETMLCFVVVPSKPPNINSSVSSFFPPPPPMKLSKLNEITFQATKWTKNKKWNEELLG